MFHKVMKPVPSWPVNDWTFPGSFEDFCFWSVTQLPVCCCSCLNLFEMSVWHYVHKNRVYETSIKYLIFVLFSIEDIKRDEQLITVRFMFYTMFQLFGNWGCRLSYFPPWPPGVSIKWEKVLSHLYVSRLRSTYTFSITG